jgi:hypothetical protein
VLQGADLRAAKLEGATLSQAQLQGADLSQARLEGADLRGASLWRIRGKDALWELADLRASSVQEMSRSEIDDVIGEATKGIPDEERRKATAERMNAGLRASERPARPDFPERWRSEPNVMFDSGDPQPEPLAWGVARWATERAYGEDLAVLLGDLACGRDVAEAATRGLARRAFEAARLEEGAPGRAWPAPFAARLIGADCPPAAGLPDNMRRQLAELAAQSAAAAPPEASPPDPIE